MTSLRTAALATLLLAATAACQQHAPDAQNTASTTHAKGTGDGSGDGLGDGLGSTVDRAMAEARTKLETENIKIGEGDRKAEISPKGDLIVDGRNVPVNDEQRRLLLEYRGQVLAVAKAGMDVGAEGAKLASKAVTEAIGGLFSGNPDRIEERVKSQAEGIKARALKLCDLLPGMYATQQKLAASIPEFVPFAKMKPDEVGNCRKDVQDDDAPPAPPAPPAPAAPPAP